MIENFTALFNNPADSLRPTFRLKIQKLEKETKKNLPVEIDFHIYVSLMAFLIDVLTRKQ